MFVLCMDSPNGFPVAMAICRSMEQALETVQLSGEWYSIGEKSEFYCDGFITKEGVDYEFSIVQCELSLQARSVFRDEN